MGTLTVSAAFWARKDLPSASQGRQEVAPFFAASFIAWVDVSSSIRCRWLDPREGGGEILLPSSHFLGALTAQELRFLHGHGDLSLAPSSLRLPGSDCERATFSRDDFHVAMEFLNNPSGSSRSVPNLGIFEGVQFRVGWSATEGRRAMGFLGSSEGFSVGGGPATPFSPVLLLRRSRATASKIPVDLLDDWRRICRIVVDLFEQFDDIDMEEQREVLWGLFLALPLLLLREQTKVSAKVKHDTLQKNFSAFLRGDIHSLYVKALKACAPSEEVLEGLSQPQAPAPGLPQPSRQARRLLDESEGVKLGLKAVELVKAGNASKAVRILTSPGMSKAPVEEVLEELRAKHPQPPPSPAGASRLGPSAEELLEAEEYFEETFDSVKIIQAVRSMQARGAKDQWGWGKEVVVVLMKEFELGELLTNYIFKPIILGRLPPRLRPYQAGAVLFALDKAPKAGVRPIAIGDFWRRVAAKAALRPLAQQLGQHFQTSSKNLFQFAAGVKGGAEKLYHTLCLLPYGLDADHCEDDPQAIMTIDISNAFNELSRPLIFDILDGKASQDYAGGRIRKGDPLPCPSGLKKPSWTVP